MAHLILSASIGGFGHHPGAAAFGQPRHLIDLHHYRHLLQIAEAGRLDFVLLDDGRALAEPPTAGGLDALTLLARLAPETSAVGLAVSKPTTYSEPFHVSRELATLDFVSGGRAAWNVTTNPSLAEAHNFGQDRPLTINERSAIATEFVAVSRKLWDSWEDDAVIVDRAGGNYLDPHKLHHINHVGPHFQIRGPQITYRPPQGQVVVIQADAGDPGVQPSAEVADVLLIYDETFAEAQQSYLRHTARAAATGRPVKILQRILPILAPTEERARARAVDLDSAAARGERVAPPRARRFVGTPAQLADQLTTWFSAGAADGFHLLPAVLPRDLETIAHELVPELQQRDLFRTAYVGRTLREHLGLPRPTSQYAEAPSEAFTAYD